MEERLLEGKIIPNQCEVAYFNSIEVENVESWGEPNRILALWSDDCDHSILGLPEFVSVGVQYPLAVNDSDGKSRRVGRLHVNFEPGLSAKTEKPIVILNLIARGEPLSDDENGMFGFFDLGRDKIVRGFRALTTEHMHKVWRLR